ncbi:DUF4183 domain-containing protein [Alkalihalobacillus macyae]|uniref:DUF4183 domain-containing protein n=1 Tax=Guptibacillus hwajinpoensis TaxID=208199 RepID=UPI00273BD29A|nr:DUF4183 domain-containing protein [Alkalihalobacillus macyae]MDP4552581.1 DUF4183 domain-containing protein [Alkalihalobacillus macyae]
MIREEFCFCLKCKSLLCGGVCSVQEADCSYGDSLPHNRKLETWTYTYNAKSDGKSFCYRNEDELKEYGSLGILNPASVSLINLFINGVLQPQVIYEVTKGCLKLKVNTAPPKDAPVILQFIAFYDSSCLH